MGLIARFFGPIIGARIVGFFSGYAVNDVVGWVESLNPLADDKDSKAQTAVATLGVVGVILAIVGAWFGYKKLTK